MRMTVSSLNYISLKLSLMMRSNIYNLKIGILLLVLEIHFL